MYQNGLAYQGCRCENLCLQVWLFFLQMVRQSQDEHHCGRKQQKRKLGAGWTGFIFFSFSPLFSVLLKFFLSLFLLFSSYLFFSLLLFLSLSLPPSLFPFFFLFLYIFCSLILHSSFYILFLLKFFMLEPLSPLFLCSCDHVAKVGIFTNLMFLFSECAISSMC